MRFCCLIKSGTQDHSPKHKQRVIKSQLMHRQKEFIGDSMCSLVTRENGSGLAKKKKKKAINVRDYFLEPPQKE